MTTPASIYGPHGSIEEKRNFLTQPPQWFMDWGSFGDNSAHEHVNEVTAMGLSAVYACANAVSTDLAKLPIRLYRDDGDRQTRVPGHPLARLLNDEPNFEMTAFALRESMQWHSMLWGNAYCEIVRTGTGRPVELWLLDPTCVLPRRIPDGSGASRLEYWVSPQPYSFKEPETVIRLQPSEIFHVHGPSYNGVVGWRIAQVARQAFGAAIAAQTFRGAFFGNGTAASLALSHPGTLSPAAFEHLRQSFHERHAGSANSWKPLILEEGIVAKELSFDPQKSQMIESLTFSVEDVLRFFRVPAHVAGHLARSTNNNIESQQISYVTECLHGHAARIESAIRQKLILKSDGPLYCRHEFDELLRGDQAARATYYGAMMSAGIMSRNEIRAKENLPPVADGDEIFVPVNLQPLSRAIEPPPPPAPILPPKPEPEGDGKAPAPPQKDEAKQKAGRSLLTQTTDRLRHAAEDKRRRGKWSETEHRAVAEQAIGPVCALAGLDAAAEITAYMESLGK